MRPPSVSVVVLAAGATLAACGLSTMGEGPPSPHDGGNDGAVGQRDGTGSSDAREDGPEASHDAPPSSDVHAMDVASDALTTDAQPPTDAPDGDGWTCTPLDGGILGTLDLSTWVFAGTASWNENTDGKITLTNSNNNEAGAAWSARQMPQVSAYDLTWSFRVGPGDTSGDGITFAVLQVAAAPDDNFVGNDGANLGLQGLQANGYAVAVDMYGTNEIRLVTMPSYTIVDSKANGDMLNDGNVYSVDVSWHAPSTLTATLHSTSGDLTVSSTNAGLTTTGPAWFGFTGSTGGSADSHNEVASLVVKDLCQ
jgi:Bacterial lectin